MKLQTKIFPFILSSSPNLQSLLVLHTLVCARAHTHLHTHTHSFSSHFQQASIEQRLSIQSPKSHKITSLSFVPSARISTLYSSTGPALWRRPTQALHSPTSQQSTQDGSPTGLTAIFIKGEVDRFCSRSFY